MNNEFQKYLKKLIDLTKNSYSPYSNFKVSSIVVSKNKKEFYGVNIENFSYSATICAERAALTNAITSGVKIKQINKLYLYTLSDDIIFPCGICLQFMIEIMNENSYVIIFNKKNKMESYKLKKIFPKNKKIKFNLEEKNDKKI